MKKIVMTTAALLAAGTVAMAQMPAQQPQYEDAIQVSGKAEKKVTPDEIYVSITIKDNDVKGQNVNQIESTMKSKLKALGIDVEKALKLNDVTNAPKKKNQVDTKRSFELKVGDVWTLNSVFEMLGELGVSQAQVTKVSNSKMADYRKEVRVAAIQAAKENAQQIAVAIGQSIGPAVYIYDNGNMYESYDMPVLMRSNKALASDGYYNAGGAEQGIDFKEITLNYQVTAKFKLYAE